MRLRSQRNRALASTRAVQPTRSCSTIGTRAPGFDEDALHLVHEVLRCKCSRLVEIPPASADAAILANDHAGRTIGVKRGPVVLPLDSLEGWM
jgi:hypothetical protein